MAAASERRKNTVRFIKKYWRRTLIIFFAVVFVFSGMLLLDQFLTGKSTRKDLQKFVLPEGAPLQEGKPPNPVDFPGLKELNPDVVGWVRIPNCDIDYPVLRPSDGNDGYYLKRNIYKKYEFAGSVFMESVNSPEFSDPVTVIYGHAMLNGTMFGSLQKFRDKEYFDARPTVYVYTPGHILSYRVFSFFRYDNRHIMRSFDFSDPEQFGRFALMCQNPEGNIKQTREVKIAGGSRLLVLSTCAGAGDKYRYLLVGVLQSDTETA